MVNSLKDCSLTYGDPGGLQTTTDWIGNDLQENVDCELPRLRGEVQSETKI